MAVPGPASHGTLRSCIDFSTMPPGAGANPIVVSTSEGKVTFEVVGADTTEIASISGFTGLRCGREVVINTDGVATVELLFYGPNASVRVTALDRESNPVGPEVITEPAMEVSIVRLGDHASGPRIHSVRIVEDIGGGALLLQCCLESRCLGVDFRDRTVGLGPNPRIEQGVSFTVYVRSGTAGTSVLEPAAQSEINHPTSSPLVIGSGLNMQYQTDILLPVRASAVEMAVVVGTWATALEAFNDDGVLVASAPVEPNSSPERIVGVEATNIARVRVNAPERETWLIWLCYE